MYLAHELQVMFAVVLVGYFNTMLPQCKIKGSKMRYHILSGIENYFFVISVTAL